MLTRPSFPTAGRDRQVTDAAGLCPARFPVARTPGAGVLHHYVHLVDGDGASLCGAFTQHQLRRLRLPWEEVGAGVRCRGCELLGTASARR